MGALALILVAGGCSHGPKRIHFDQALPACEAFVPVLTSVGMPGPHLSPEPSLSNPRDGVDCLYTAKSGSTPPVVAAVTITVSRPSYESSEKDPAKRFGTSWVAKDFCSGAGAANAALPASSSCYEPRSSQYAVMTVTSFTRQSAIRVSLDWTDTTPVPEKLRSDALDKANAVAQSVIGML